MLNLKLVTTCCTSDCIKDYHEDLHQKFVIPIDKANGIVAVIAKDFMRRHSQKNPKIFKINPETYKTCVDKTANQFIHSHTDTILNHFNISLNALMPITKGSY